MAKVTSEITPVVCVTIKGEGGDGPRVRKDDGLVLRFVEFIHDNGIYPAMQGGYSGAGSYCGFFSAENAEIIRGWLREQGVTING